jgi:Flp pilus assembly protein TadG
MRNLILGLARPVLRLLGRDERGVIGVLVAMMFGAGVLTGMGALVIDAGQLFQERAELQNGADAAALAVAKSCATGTCAAAAATTLAAQYANANASALTGNTAASVVCGTGTLGACPGVTGAQTDCPVAPVGGAGYVDVRTSTKVGASLLLPPIFAKSLLGNGSYQGSTVKACAQAQWGGASSPIIITAAFTISVCEWQKATTNGTVYQSATAPSVSFDQQIKLRISGSTGTGCNAGTSYPSPDDAVSLFGWMIEGNPGGCTWNQNTPPGATYLVLTSPPTDCNPGLFNDWTNRHTVIDMPVYTSVTGIGASAVYHLQGIYAFVVTGYNVPATFGGTTSEPDWLNAALSCSGATYCINGYFVSPLVPYTGTISASSVGLQAVKLSG